MSCWWGRVFSVAALEDREYQIDRLEFVKNQLSLLIDDIKKKIKAISEDVESKVTQSAHLKLWFPKLFSSTPPPPLFFSFQAKLSTWPTLLLSPKHIQPLSL